MRDDEPPENPVSALDALVDEASRGSFPASDPPGWWAGTSPDGTVPSRNEEGLDAVGAVVAEALRDLIAGAAVLLENVPVGSSAGEAVSPGRGASSATGDGPPGWDTTVTVRLLPRVAKLLDFGSSALGELVAVLPAAALRTSAQLRGMGADHTPAPALRRAARDMLAAEILATYAAQRLGSDISRTLVGEIIDYLIELSGTRVEAHDLTHGVVLADVLVDEPRLVLRYPADIRTAKRAPLLFDGQRSVLLVDPHGRARTELQRHRIDRLAGVRVLRDDLGDGWVESGWLVAQVTKEYGGLGFYVRADRSVWTFVDGQPLLVRRGEHWTAFPVELAASISNMIGGGRAAEVVARAAYMIATRPQGAILAVVDDPAVLDGVVSLKDRYDLRHEIDLSAMRPETRLHHLLDAGDLEEHALARLAALDGATVLDRDARLVTYGAIVTSSDSQHEGARTAAARTLSHTALVVLKVSVDGDITVFRHGDVVTTLLAPTSQRASVGEHASGT